MASEAVPPPFRITAHDKSGLIIVTVALTLSFVWVCFFIRLWLRSQTREWKSDDWWLTIATLLQTTQSALVFHAVHSGLGAPLDSAPFSKLDQLGREGLASQILYASTLFASKCSVLYLYLRISPGRSHRVSSWSILAASTIWIIIAIILIAVPCNPIGWYTARDTCTNLWPKWQAISALDIATELCIFAIAAQLVWSLNMRMTSKLLVVFAFSARLPVIALAVTRLHFVKATFVHGDTTYIYLIATQWQMGYATMSSTITGMGPLLRPFNKEYTTSYHKKSAYGQHESCHHPQGSTMQASQLRPGISWKPQSYQLNPLNQPHSNNTIDISGPAALPPTPCSSESDPTFRPANEILISGMDIWVGNRTSRDEEDLEAMSDETRLVIKKRTELTVQTDKTNLIA